jgi:hypothetical protein
MSGYTKLFNSILLSTIWREDDKTRIVWITLLAMADKHGNCETSIPSLADAARVSLSDCVASLEKLKSPDEWSRTKEHEGRRIEECDGGFMLLNHAKYRAKMSLDERREYNRVKKAESRQKCVSKCQTKSMTVNDKNGSSALSAHTEADSDTKAEAIMEGEAPLPSIAIKEVFDSWNKLDQLPKCLIVSDKRRQRLRVRLNEQFFKENWREAMCRISASAFLIGENDTGWKASFDWFIQPDSVAKIMEGKYHGKPKDNQRTGPDRNAGTFNAARVGQPISSKIR